MEEKIHIAPCGINCVLCYAYQREKKRCPGCGAGQENKPYHCSVCAIAHCEQLDVDGARLCYTCRKKFPCSRLKQLDKRYRLKHGLSPVDNLRRIQREGMEAFERGEQRTWTCPSCGRNLCVHHPECMACGGEIRISLPTNV